MSDGREKPGSERFCPEIRGWAALRLAALVPDAVREEVESGPGPPAENADFRQAALAAVSGIEAIRWSRAMAERVPALGVAGGPACLARLWVAGLLRPGGAIGPYWPSVVDEAWAVVRPALEKMGVAARGPGWEELRHDFAVPLALVFLRSLAAGRKDLRLVRDERPDRPDGPPLGWAPGVDALRPLLRYLLLGQVPGRFLSHAFMSSPLAVLVCRAGLVVPVRTMRWECPLCRVRPSGETRFCPHCGSPLVGCCQRWLVARSAVEHAPSWQSPEAGVDCGAARGAAGGGQTPVHERAEARWLRRECLQRAVHLWDEVMRGPGHGVAAMVVLGALAGVRPLAAVADRPPAQREWLEHLVDVLASGRLDREPLARAADAACDAVARRTGGRQPQRILSAYVGVLATRFRHKVFRPRAAGPSDTVRV